MYGWHFIGKKLRDGSPIPKDGVWLPKIAPIALCMSGYHGSKQPFDALRYAPGNTLCCCEYKGTMVLDTDKFVAEQRLIVARIDATDMLRYFARMQAVSVAHLWEPPDAVLDYLMTGDESLRAAANAAANDAAYAAARAAANAAANAAAYDAAYDAARAAAYDAANAAAHDAARAEFNALVYECFGMENDNHEPRT